MKRNIKLTSFIFFQRQPYWVNYHELVMTTKEYTREVMVIDPKWLVEMAPRFFKVAEQVKTTRKDWATLWQTSQAKFLAFE